MPVKFQGHSLSGTWWTGQPIFFRL